MSTSLPLPKGFFNTNVHVSEDMRRQYVEFAEGSIRKVFALSDCHKNSWIPMREKKGVAIYRNFGQMRGPNAYKSNIAEVGCKGELNASLEQVGRAYAAHDDALFRRLMKKLNPAVMDAAVLSTIVPRTPLTPYRYIGIKWYAVKTPTPIVSHRDYCCLEVQDKIVDSFGNEMYIRVLNSIEVNECPSLENSHGLVRAKILAGYMYRTDRAEPNVVRVHHVARLDPGGYFPSQWAFKTAESQLVNSIVQIRRIIDKQQMNACTFVDKRQWVPNHERLHCAVCSRTLVRSVRAITAEAVARSFVANAACSSLWRCLARRSRTSASALCATWACRRLVDTMMETCRIYLPPPLHPAARSRTTK